MQEVTISCDFAPVAKARPRLGRGGRTFTPDKTVKFEKAVAHAARHAMGNKPPINAPCQVEIYAVFRIPESWPNWRRELAGGRPYTCRSDADNMIKAICDGMNGIVLEDDRLAAHVSMQRFYGVRDQFRVTVSALEGVPTSRSKQDE